MPAQQLRGMPEAFKYVPLASPPPGDVQNLENPQSRSYQVYIISAVFVALSISFMTFRLYAKAAIQRSRTWDDCWFHFVPYLRLCRYCLKTRCLCSCVSKFTDLRLFTLLRLIKVQAGILSYVGVTIASLSQPGGGKHLWDTVIGDYSEQGFIESVVSTAIYGPVIYLVKLALFLLYLHLFGRLRWLKWLVWWGIAMTGLFYIPAIFIAFILCAPTRGGTWLERSMSPKCRNGLLDYGVAQGTMNVLSDFYLLIIPIP